MPHLETDLAPKVPVRITWWGCAALAIDSGDRSIAIDPYVEPADGRFEHVFLTHEHYDHLYEPTLRTITASPRFKLAVVARSCVLPTALWYSRTLNFLRPDQVVVLYPKYVEPSHGWEMPGPTELRLGQWHVEGVHSPGEEADVPIDVVGPVIQNGYLIRDAASGIAFYVPGDLCEPYPALAELRGKVDVMFLPCGKMGLEKDAVALDLIRPRYVVPIHYRYAENYPIPKAYTDDQPIEQQTLGFQFPGPDDPDAYIASLAEIAAPLNTRVLKLLAGVPYDL